MSQTTEKPAMTPTTLTAALHDARSIVVDQLKSDGRTATSVMMFLWHSEKYGWLVRFKPLGTRFSRMRCLDEYQSYIIDRTYSDYLVESQVIDWECTIEAVWEDEWTERDGDEDTAPVASQRSSRDQDKRTVDSLYGIPGETTDEKTATRLLNRVVGYLGYAALSDAGLSALAATHKAHDTRPR